MGDEHEGRDGAEKESIRFLIMGRAERCVCWRGTLGTARGRLIPRRLERCISGREGTATRLVCNRKRSHRGGKKVAIHEARKYALSDG